MLTEKSLKDNKKEPLSRHFCILIIVLSWQGHKDLNPEPTVLETSVSTSDSVRAATENPFCLNEKVVI